MGHAYMYQESTSCITRHTWTAKMTSPYQCQQVAESGIKNNKSDNKPQQKHRLGKVSNTSKVGGAR